MLKLHREYLFEEMQEDQQSENDSMFWFFFSFCSPAAVLSHKFWNFLSKFFSDSWMDLLINSLIFQNKHFLVQILS